MTILGEDAGQHIQSCNVGDPRGMCHQVQLRVQSLPRVNIEEKFVSEPTGLTQCPYGLLEVIQVVASMIFHPAHKGRIEHASQVHYYPLPRLSTRWAVGEQRAAYLTYGNPDIKSRLSVRAKYYGWSYVEQLGAAHILTVGPYRLTVITQKCTRFLTIMEFILSEQRP